MAGPYNYTTLADTTSTSSGLHGLFSPDGIYFYAGADDTEKLERYTLTSAWDISTITGSRDQSASIYQAGIMQDPGDVFIAPNGYDLYVISRAENKIVQYTITTAWDITSAISYVQNIDANHSSATGPRNIFFKPDGTKMFVTFYSMYLTEYALSTPWDISTASVTTDITDAVTYNLYRPNGLWISSDGSKLVSLAKEEGRLGYGEMSTAWDISTLSWGTPWLLSADWTPYLDPVWGVTVKPNEGTLIIYGSSATYGPSIIAYTGTSISSFSRFWTNFHGLREAE